MGTGQRRNARINRELPARIANTIVSVKNITRSGLQAACPGMLFDFLAPALRSGTTDIAITLGDNEVARMQCRVVYVSQCGDEYLMGLEFTAFEQNSESLLIDLVTEREQSAA